MRDYFSFFAFMLYLLTLESDTLTALKYSIFWFIFLGITYFMFIRKKLLKIINKIIHKRHIKKG